MSHYAAQQGATGGYGAPQPQYGAQAPPGYSAAQFAQQQQQQQQYQQHQQLLLHAQQLQQQQLQQQQLQQQQQQQQTPQQTPQQQQQQQQQQYQQQQYQQQQYQQQQYQQQQYQQQQYQQQQQQYQQQQQQQQQQLQMQQQQQQMQQQQQQMQQQQAAGQTQPVSQQGHTQQQQYASQPYNNQPAGGAGGSLPGGVEALVVTGCQSATVSGIIRGTYTPHSENHGRPVYKKTEQVNRLDILMYFWDERDGPNFCGWWFGPKVGGDHVWAYNPDRAATPPPGQWKVPYDGPVDSTLAVTPTKAPEQPQQGQQQQQQQQQYQQQGYAGQAQQAPSGGANAESAWGKPAQGENPEQQRLQQQEAERQRQQAEYQRWQEAELQRRQEEERRRQVAEAEARRQQEENRRRQEEAARILEADRRRRDEEMRQKREAEEKRRQEEVARRQREEEQRRQQQASVLAVRKVIQSVRTTQQLEELEPLRAELDEVLAREGPNCGPHQGTVQEEANAALQEAKARIEAAAKQKEEQERRRKEQEELAAKFFEELSVLVVAAESSLGKLKEVAGAIPAGGGAPLEEVTKTWSDIKGSRAETRTKCKACTDFLVANRDRLEGLHTFSAETKEQLQGMQKRIHETFVAQVECLNALVCFKAIVKKAKAARVFEKRAAVFNKYDRDGDGIISKREIVTYAKEQLKFDAPLSVVDRVIKQVGVAPKGVPRDQHQRMRTALAIAREEAAARVRIEEAARRRKELEEQKEKRRKQIEQQRSEMQDKVSEAVEEISECAKCVGKADAAIKALPPKVRIELTNVKAVGSASAEEISASELASLAGQVEEAVKSVKDQHARAKAGQEVVGELAPEKELQDFLQGKKRELSTSMDFLNERVVRYATSLVRLNAVVKRKELAELRRCRAEVCEVLRRHKSKTEQEGDGLLGVVDKDGKGSVSESDFLAFFTNCEDKPESLDEDKLERVFRDAAAGKETIGKDEFEGLQRTFYKCIKQTMLTKGAEITPEEPQVVRRVIEGEILEAVEAPHVEESTKVTRVRAIASRDGAEGYIPIAGNEGTKFFEEVGAVYQVVKSSDLTENFEVENGQEPTRKLAEGEVVEVIAWGKKEPESVATRLQVKAREDWVTGWATATDSEGTMFMKPV